MLELEDLAFRYRGNDADLFGGLTHSFQAGSMTAVTGPSGRGKSTLLYVLGLMLTPSRGTVLIGGSAASNLREDERAAIRAETIGFVFQDAVLDASRTLLDNVLEPTLYVAKSRKDGRERAEYLMERMGVRHRRHHRPGEVSGGQAQRAAVCRALINSPTVVLADEPTGNLDRDNARVVLTALRELSTNAAIVVASHDPFVVDFADQVLVL